MLRMKDMCQTETMVQASGQEAHQMSPSLNHTRNRVTRFLWRVLGTDDFKLKQERHGFTTVCF